MFNSLRFLKCDVTIRILKVLIYISQTLFHTQGNERKNKASPINRNKPKTEGIDSPTDVKVQEQRNSSHRNYPIPDIVVRQPKEEQEKDINRFRRPSLKLLPPADTIDQLSDTDNMSIVSETSSAGGSGEALQKRGKSRKH